MLHQINETHRPVFITQNGEPRAVLQDPESYEKMKASLAMMKIVGIGEMEIRRGKSVEQDEMFKRLIAKLEHRRASLASDFQNYQSDSICPGSL